VENGELMWYRFPCYTEHLQPGACTSYPFHSIKKLVLVLVLSHL